MRLGGSSLTGRTVVRGFRTIRAVAFAGLAAMPVAAQNGPVRSGMRSGRRPARPVAQAAEAAHPPVIDGRLDDDVWGDAPLISGFVQREPVEGEPVSERTEVRILADGQAIYIAAWLYDRAPERIVEGEKLRDANIETGDYFAILLDTYHDRQNGFMFATTPAGIEYDGQVVKEGQGGGVFQRGQNRQQAGAMGGFNVNWDASWDVAVSRDGRGWYAEFRIPFSTLRYAGGREPTWGMNLVRRIRRKNEESSWAPIPRQFNFYRLSLAGDLEGLRPPSLRAGYVTPYALGGAERNYLQESSAHYPAELGGDAKFTLTPALTLDVTYNTDFAQVEVDEQRTNLTRFPLFFPEKRPFFLENAGVFSAGTPQAADLFFSRRIGISPSGNPVPILGGARLSGKAAGFGIGVLQIFTDAVDDEVAEQSFSVARVTHELPNRSRAGAIFVQRRATKNGSDFNRTYGADGRVGLGESLTVDWWLARTETSPTDRPLGRQDAESVFANFESRTWRSRLRLMRVGEDFNPEVGFVNRVGYRHVEAFLERVFRFPNVSWLRETNPHVTYRGYWGFDGLLESSRLHFDAELKFAGGGRFGPELNIVKEGLREPFEIAPGVSIPAGSYTAYVNSWDYGSDPSRPVSFLGRADLGQFFDGHRYGGNVTVTYRKGATLSTSLLLDHNIVRLPEGNFDTSLLGLRLGYFFTPRIFLQSLVQYSDQADVWSVNARFAWLNTAGTGLYVVYNEAQEATSFSRLTQPLHRGLTVKYTRQVRVF